MNPKPYLQRDAATPPRIKRGKGEFPHRWRFERESHPKVEGFSCHGYVSSEISLDDICWTPCLTHPDGPSCGPPRRSHRGIPILMPLPIPSPMNWPMWFRVDPWRPVEWHVVAAKTNKGMMTKYCLKTPVINGCEWIFCMAIKWGDHAILMGLCHGHHCIQLLLRGKTVGFFLWIAKIRESLVGFVLNVNSPE